MHIICNNKFQFQNDILNIGMVRAIQTVLAGTRMSKFAHLWLQKVCVLYRYRYTFPKGFPTSLIEILFLDQEQKRIFQSILNVIQYK